MILYMDSSALVKLYVREVGSDAVRSLVSRSEVCVTSAISYAEIRSAMARRFREGAVNAAWLEQAKAALLDDWQGLFVVPVILPIARRSGDLAESYALRGMDSIHLATALWLQSQQNDITLTAWDTRLVAAAVAAGFLVEGPAMS